MTYRSFGLETCKNQHANAYSTARLHVQYLRTHLCVTLYSLNITELDRCRSLCTASTHK